MTTSQRPGMTLLPGISEAVALVNQRLCEFATRDVPVFITGEPGTEKAFAAKLVHQLSRRADRPLAKVTVSWKLPPDFTEHFRQCHGGTLILSLQREFPVDLQYLVLEIVGEQSITHSSGHGTVESDVRLLVTTSLPLEALKAQRELLPEVADMVARAHVVIPPVRERPEDIPALVRYATQRAADTGRSKARGADAQVLALFRAWRWPGNAEDLLLVTAEAALNCQGDLISLNDLPQEFLAGLPEELIEQARRVSLPRATPLPAADRPSGESRLPTVEELKRDRQARLHEESTEILPVASVLAAASKADSSDTTRVPPAESSAPPAPEETAEQATRLQRLVTLARRLNRQSQVLSRQMKGPLSDHLAELTDQILEEPGGAERVADALERELDQGLHTILALRRQLAVLNRREQQALQTARDLYRRLSMASDDTLPMLTNEELAQDTRELAAELQELDTIIRRVSQQFPNIDLSDFQLGEENLPGSIREEEARVIAEALRRAREQSNDTAFER